ncbi:B-cell receptor CD22-like [Sinocyclocheilus rhinocerous]|uniref:B-cell receptor CD22-like n=1 Tax=Sinocyclocheilus rhinocerous TaxID=307959 RepID=UPI0007B9E383|nr:PREDICTED: B-cell receptor CD22-like [Sinocyclocheilus rhinocerous]
MFSPALQVKAPQLVLEKQTVGLICETTCSLTDAFIWYKNGEALKIHSKTLQLQSERSDSGRYSCAVRGHEHLPSPAVSITLISLQVKAPQLVLEKQTVGLTCETTCNLTDAFIWYKNGEALKIHSKTLQLQSERSDSGRYSCAVRGHEHLPSPAVSITVVYPPQSTSVSISPSGEIVERDSVTLSCSSDSNPPAEISWFKEDTFLKYGDTYSITDIKSEDSGNYYCSARNKHGSQASAAVTVNVMYPPQNVSVSRNGSGEIVEGDSVALSCSSDSNPPAEISWFKEDTLLGSGDTYSITDIKSEDSGNYYCSARNKHGSQASAAVTTSAGKASESGDAENASVQDGRDTDTKKPEEEEIEYASITIHHPASEAK